MKDKIKVILKYNKLELIMSITTFLIGIMFYNSSAIGIPIAGKLMIITASFIPFFTFLLIIVLSYYFKEKYIKVFKIISIIFSLLLVFYYLIALIICALTSVTNPVTDPKYYNRYVNGERFENVFPKEIPKNVKNVNFCYAPGILQGGTFYSLYYIDENMTKEKFDKKYKNKSIWIGHKEEYKEKSGLLSHVFAYSPVDYDNENDYLIYLIKGECDDSGYCNHGELLLVAFNEKTNEVLFKSGDW